MQIVSEIIKIKKQNNPTTNYIESELKNQGIIPLRWAIVNIDEENFYINCAYEVK